MTALAETQTTERPSLAARLAANSDGILEQIAQEYGVSTFEVVRNLPGDHASVVPGEHFGDIMEALTGWGDVLFIVHTPDIVLECEGKLPPGTFGRGYFNLHGDSPIGGHIKAENCRHIAFVARPFMGRASRSIQFFNGDGERDVQDLRQARRGAQPHRASRWRCSTPCARGTGRVSRPPSDAAISIGPCTCTSRRT